MCLINTDCPLLENLKGLSVLRKGIGRGGRDPGDCVSAISFQCFIENPAFLLSNFLKQLGFSQCS